MQILQKFQEIQRWFTQIIARWTFLFTPWEVCTISCFQSTYNHGHKVSITEFSCIWKTLLGHNSRARECSKMVSISTMSEVSGGELMLAYRSVTATQAYVWVFILHTGSFKNWTKYILCPEVYFGLLISCFMSVLEYSMIQSWNCNVTVFYFQFSIVKAYWAVPPWHSARHGVGQVACPSLGKACGLRWQQVTWKRSQ